MRCVIEAKLSSLKVERKYIYNRDVKLLFYRTQYANFWQRNVVLMHICPVNHSVLQKICVPKSPFYEILGHLSNQEVHITTYFPVRGVRLYRKGSTVAHSHDKVGYLVDF